MKKLLFCCLAALFILPQSEAYTVVREASDGSDAKEKLTVFDRSSKIKVTDPVYKTAKFRFEPDNTLILEYDSNRQIRPYIQISDSGIDISQYRFLVLTLSIDGVFNRLYGPKNAVPQPWAKLNLLASLAGDKGPHDVWNIVQLYNFMPGDYEKTAKGKDITIKIPLELFLRRPAVKSPTSARSLQLELWPVGGNIERHITIKIKRIAFAE